MIDSMSKYIKVSNVRLSTLKVFSGIPVNADPGLCEYPGRTLQIGPSTHYPVEWTKDP